MSRRKPFLLDANVFIEAKNSYYAFGICPGFWKSLIRHHKAGNVCSISHVRDELLRGKDNLSEWAENKMPDAFFRSTEEAPVIDKFREVMIWVNRNSQFNQVAKADFASGADGWLVAYAATQNLTVVTQEQLRPDAKNRIPIPNVCRQFGVRFEDTFAMLEALKIRFDWNG